MGGLEIGQEEEGGWSEWTKVSGGGLSWSRGGRWMTKEKGRLGKD